MTVHRRPAAAILGPGVVLPAAVAAELATVLDAVPPARLAACAPAVIEAVSMIRLLRDHHRAATRAVPRRELDVAEAAVILGLTPRSVRRYATGGQLVGRRTVGGHWLLDAASVEAMARARA